MLAKPVNKDKVYTVSELCNKFKIGYNTVNNRLHMGWSVEKAIQIKEVI
jgi:ribosomal protein L7Ae-like RNA K-turn-binding protein